MAVGRGEVNLDSDDSSLTAKRGIFVSIYSWPEKKLRGCIGFVHADLPLWECVQRAALSAAFDDPRFSPLKPDELRQTIFEISVLEEPQPIEISPQDYEKKIEVGRDGLILEHPPFSGLFLPQVWAHFPTVEEFLENLAYKAGLTPDYVWHPRTRISKFRVQVFAEAEPQGKVTELTKYGR
jgi:hypothetical protein